MLDSAIDVAIDLPIEDGAEPLCPFQSDVSQLAEDIGATQKNVSKSIDRLVASRIFVPAPEFGPGSYRLNIEFETWQEPYRLSPSQIERARAMEQPDWRDRLSEIGVTIATPPRKRAEPDHEPGSFLEWLWTSEQPPTDSEIEYSKPWCGMPDEVAASREIGVNASVCLMGLQLCSEPDGRCLATDQEIGKKYGVDARRAARGIAELIRKGFIVADESPDGGRVLVLPKALRIGSRFGTIPQVLDENGEPVTGIPTGQGVTPEAPQDRPVPQSEAVEHFSQEQFDAQAEELAEFAIGLDPFHFEAYDDGPKRAAELIESFGYDVAKAVLESSVPRMMDDPVLSKAKFGVWGCLYREAQQFIHQRTEAARDLTVPVTIGQASGVTNA